MKFIKKFSETFFLNTMLVIISAFIVKLLGLINKIVITNLLGTQGMSIYVLAFPTIILFINLSSLSLNISMSKAVSETLKTNNHNIKIMIKEAFKIALINCLILELIYILVLPFIVNNLLKTQELYYPLLTVTILIPLVGITDTLRGVFAGLKNMKTIALVNILEQVSRISFSVIMLLLFKKYSLVLCVSFTILGLSIGEACSLIFLIFKLRKITLPNYKTSGKEKQVILQTTIPTTLAKLTGSLTYFLEPVINTLVLLSLGYKITEINTNYTIINAYVLPLLTITTFLSTSIATVIIPSIAEKNATNKKDSINYLINKVLFFSLTPGILISILLFLFPSHFMNLLFSTNLGIDFIKKYAFIFIIHYLEAPGIAILQSLGFSKKMFKISCFFNILRVLLIAILPRILGLNSIFYAITITMFLQTIVIWMIIILKTSLKVDISKLINLIMISISTISIGIIVKNISESNYILISVGISLIYLLLISYYKIITIKSISRR